MDLPDFRALLTPAGQVALAAAIELAPQEKDFLAHLQQLTRSYPQQLARSALEIAALRLKAAQKFPFARSLYFTRESLEQASSWEIAAYRSIRYRDFGCIADLGCSAGGDLLALAGQASVIGIDRDPLRLALAQANLQALDLAGRASLLQADLSASLPLLPSTKSALFFDPARRAAGRRIFSVNDYQPPLDTVRSWLPRFPALGVKISPGVELDELSVYDAGIEFVSLHGELKEAVLWFGPLRRADRTATLLPGPHSLAAESAALASVQAESARLSEPLAYLYEPDPAILRAGLVRLLARRLDACQLDPDIAYLTAGTLQPTPFARAWAVYDWFPYQLKRLRAYLRSNDVGHVTVKKRGSPLQPEELIRSLRLSGAASRVLFLTHLRGKPVVIVAAPTPLP